MIYQKLTVRQYLEQTKGEKLTKDICYYTVKKHFNNKKDFKISKFNQSIIDNNYCLDSSFLAEKLKLTVPQVNRLKNLSKSKPIVLKKGKNGELSKSLRLKKDYALYLDKSLINHIMLTISRLKKPIFKYKIKEVQSILGDLIQIANYYETEQKK